MKKIFFFIITILSMTTINTTKSARFNNKNNLSGIRLTKFLLKQKELHTINTAPLKTVKKNNNFAVKQNNHLDPALLPTQKRNRIR